MGEIERSASETSRSQRPLGAAHEIDVVVVGRFRFWLQTSFPQEADRHS